MQWLEEGLSTYATPESDDCDGYTLEQKYAYLLQNNKKMDLEKFPTNIFSPDFKVARMQSAYLVSCLLGKYGIAKLKQLWTEGMVNFEEIFGESLVSEEEEIKNRLLKKYKRPLVMDWLMFSLYCSEPLIQRDFSNNEELVKMMTEEYGKITLSVDSLMSVSDRQRVIEEVDGYITQNLDIIAESEFNDSIHIILAPNRYEIQKLTGLRVGGLAVYTKGEASSKNLIFSLYRDGYTPLKHEIMHIVSFDKWGRNNIIWLYEGLAMFGGFDALYSGRYTLEEIYLYLLQNSKLIEANELNNYSLKDGVRNIVKAREFYNQSGYIVQYLIENYEIVKLKQLWQSSMDEFEKIYSLSFSQMIENINSELNEKYPEKIDFDEERMKMECIE